MDFLSNPNVAYLLLAGGLISTVLALVAPGTGILELVSFSILGVAGWSIYANEMPINWWALIVVVIGAVLFYFSITTRKRYQMTLLVIAIVFIVLGSVFLFRSQEWWKPAVNPFLAMAVSVLSSGFFWLAARKVIEARKARPLHDLNALIGATGEAKTSIHMEGSVQVDSELWSARSVTPIPRGARVRVVSREGFTLQVEAIEKPEP
jgi:membrane-bound serine protease (ClpP class)